MNETIAAISTTLGVGAVSIIRVSGDESINIVNNIFKGKDLTNADSHTINYGYIVEKNKKIDEVLVSVMKSPKTFTRENVVEINCHGGISITNKILELVLNNGARLAEPGEFTKRAFLNGRIDLIEAEGIMNLISAKTEKSREISINQLNGNASNIIKKIREELIKIISNIEVNIDYPEYEDIEEITNEKILPNLKEILKKLKEILKNSETANLINDGINLGIIGKPNVGKSSLLNLLLNEDKAIVTDVAGTTRDIVEGKIIIKGILFNLIDTAGIRETDNVVEKIGVEKSLNIIEKSNLIIYMLNNNEPLNEIDYLILDKIKNKDSLIVINKIDLDNKIKNEDIINNAIQISIKNKIGIKKLLSNIEKKYNIGNITTSDFTYISSAKSISSIKKVITLIETATYNIEKNYPIDIVEIDIQNSWNILGEIIGETYSEELLDELFSRFCLGK